MADDASDLGTPTTWQTLAELFGMAGGGAYPLSSIVGGGPLEPSLGREYEGVNWDGILEYELSMQGVE